jgi:hypothetical protein
LRRETSGSPTSRHREGMADRCSLPSQSFSWPERSNSKLHWGSTLRRGSMMPSRFERMPCRHSNLRRNRGNRARRDNKTPSLSWRHRDNRVHQDSKVRQDSMMPSWRSWRLPPCSPERRCWKASRPMPSRSGRVRRRVRQAQTNCYASKSSNAWGS